jgi:hypothetical protein
MITMNADEDVVKQEPLQTVDGNVNQYRHSMEIPQKAKNRTAI